VVRNSVAFGSATAFFNGCGRLGAVANYKLTLRLRAVRSYSPASEGLRMELRLAAILAAGVVCSAHMARDEAGTFARLAEATLWHDNLYG
jgi:hypothetical protein